MPLVELTIDLRQDGAPMPGYPMTIRLTPAETILEKVTHTGNDGSNFVSISKFNTENGFVLFTDTQLSILLNGAPSGGITLFPGGLIMVLNGALTAGQSNVTINNTTGNVATITFYEIGP